jgi:hypothetical protein
LRKATSCREIELLDSFVSNKILETIMDCLKKYGLQNLKDLEKNLLDKSFNISDDAISKRKI